MWHRPLPDIAYLRRRLVIDHAGVLRWRPRPDSDFTASKYALTWNAKHAGLPAGGEKGNGYRMVRIDGVSYLQHRIVFALTKGDDPGVSVVDHIDGDSTDSKANNLQRATNAENVRKRSKLGSNNTSGVLGVHWHSAAGKWCAGIRVDGKDIHLGLFTDLAEAETVRKAAAAKYFGAFAPII